MRKFFIALMCLFVFDVSARTLHYGEKSVELTNTQYTTPALHILIGGTEHIYGALYNHTVAPTNTVRVLYQGKTYWLGPWCAWRRYLSAIGPECIDIPEDALNRFLTLAEVNKYIVPTDISQWELISVCNEMLGLEKCNKDIEVAKNMPECGCAAGTLQPGAYLFREYYYQSGNGPWPKSQIVIFDHPVGYRSQHSRGVFESLIDTEHETFESYTLATPYYTSVQESTNVANMPSVHNIYVYRLK